MCDKEWISGLSRASSIAAAVVSVVACVATPSAAETLRLNNWVPVNHLVTRTILNPWIADVDRVTNGQIKIEWTAGSLGAPQRQYQLAVDGVADVAWGLAAYSPGQFKLTRISELPFLNTSGEATSVALWKLHQKYFVPMDEFKGTKLVTLHVPTPSQMYLVKKEIKEIGDFKGLRIRSSNEAVSNFLNAVGAAPSFLSAGEVREALARGVVDGTTNEDSSIIGFGLSKLVKHSLKVPGGYYSAPMFLVINKAKWDGLPAEHRAAVDSISELTLARKAGQAFDSEEETAGKELASIGLKSTYAQGKLLEDIERAFAPMTKQWVDTANAQGLNGAAVLAEFKQSIIDYKK